ncbi:MAG: LCP family protein [Streptomyces sp.]
MTDSGPENDRAGTEGTADTADTAGGGDTAGKDSGESTHDTDDSGSSSGKNGSGHPRRRRLRWAAGAVSVALLAGAGVGWSLYQNLDGNIRTDVDTAQELRQHEAERPDAAPGEAENILLLGSDSRGGGNGAYGDDIGERSDTAILLHVAADRRSATGVSIPRDLMVDIPGCTARDGGRTPARFAQFNWAFQYGGAACTIRTVEKLTGTRVDHHLTLDFSGFKKLVDTVGGVEVCLPAAVRDRDARLDLPAGRQTLDGEDALGYVRARHGIGNGSDTQRIGRQQQFLGSLVKKVRDDEVLLNPAKLYPVLDSATSALTADSGLDSLTELYELVRGVRDIPTDRVRFLTVPRQSYALDANRDELVQPDADRLFAQLREDRPIRVANGSGNDREAGTAEPGRPSGPSARPGNQPSRDAVESPAKPSPTYRGTTAARDVCAADDAGIGMN